MNRPWRFSQLAFLFIGIALVTVLSYQVINRLMCPWDTLMWPESAFMTNLWKLSTGQSPFTDPADANSFVYSPGLEYLTYALLAPFGVETDVRFCRLVVILLGAVAAYLLARFSRRLLNDLPHTREHSSLFLPIAFLGFLLIVFKNMMGDVTHPDNLHLLYLAIGLCLGAKTISSGRFLWALVTVSFLAIGVLGKQTAAFGFLGGLAFFVATYRKEWGRRRIIVLFATGVAVFLGCLWILWGFHPFAKFYLFDLLRAHEIEWRQVGWFFDGLLKYPHRLLLYPLAIAALVAVHIEPASPLRRLPRFWVLFGATAVLPTLLAYVKVGGAENNLTVIDFFLAALVFPILYRWVANGSHSAGSFKFAASATALLLLIVLPWPSKRPPSDAEVLRMSEWEALLRDDLRRGHEVLVLHGASILLGAGATRVPKDRIISLIELVGAGRERLARTVQRIEAGFYARIYAIDYFTNIVPGVRRAILRNYTETERIRTGEGGTPTWNDRAENLLGMQPELWNHDFVVYGRGALKGHGRLAACWDETSSIQ